MTPVAQFAALGDDVRCRVLELLCDRPRPVHELAAQFAISRPAISRHLRVLKEAGLVREEKRGRENVYALETAEMVRMGRWLVDLRPSRPEQTKGRVRLAPSHAAPDLFGFAG